MLHVMVLHKSVVIYFAVSAARLSARYCEL